MKKRISFLLLLMSITIFGWSHVITPQCQKGSRFSFQASLFLSTGNVRVTIVNSQGNSVGIYDTVFASTPTFTFSIPKPANVNYRIRVRSQNASGSNISWEGFSQTTSAVCSTLPLTFGAFKVTDLGNSIVQISLTTYDETNMDHINIVLSRDGVTFKTILTLLPNNRNMEYTYTSIIDLKKQLP